jgi:tellurium resistance protein TerZ
MRGLLGDADEAVIRGGPNDNTAYLLPDQYVDMAKCSTLPLTAVSVGVKWDTAEGKKIDLDLNCFLLSRDYAIVDAVHYQQLRSSDGSVVHGGDTRKDKEGEDDDEQVHIQLDAVPSTVTFLCFYLTSYTGNPLEDVETCCARVLDSESQRSVALLDCDDAEIKKQTALLLCMLIRVGKRWVFYNGTAFSPGTAVAENQAHAQSFIPASETIQRLLIVSLVKHEEHEFEVSDADAQISIHASWAYGARGTAEDVFGASVAVFDRQGKFVDGVDSRRFVSRRGPRLTHHNHSTSRGGHEEIIINFADPKQENVSAYYVLVNGRCEGSDLARLEDVGVRILCGAKNMETCRYIVSPVSESARGLIFVQIRRHAEDSKVSWSKMMLIFISIYLCLFIIVQIFNP